jgi:hypothetical protein
MKNNSCINVQPTGIQGFDLFRLSKSKEAVDLCSNTLRAYHAEGLPFYRNGKVVFVSKTELEAFIRNPVIFKGRSVAANPDAK